MFYQMITNARNRWFASSECTAQGIIAYIEKANQMRDAQIDAIKTYLYLKIACGCAPLAKLFCQGAFNTWIWSKRNFLQRQGLFYLAIRLRLHCSSTPV